MVLARVALRCDKLRYVPGCVREAPVADKEGRLLAAIGVLAENILVAACRPALLILHLQQALDDMVCLLADIGWERGEVLVQRQLLFSTELLRG